MCPSLALEQDFEANEGVDLKNSDAVDPTVARFASYSNLLKARLSQKALAKSLESGWWQRLHDLKCLFSVAFGSIRWRGLLRQLSHSPFYLISGGFRAGIRRRSLHTPNQPADFIVRQVSDRLSLFGKRPNASLRRIHEPAAH